MGIRETWCQQFAKCVLNFTGTEAIHACKDDHLYAGLKTIIDGAVHRFQSIWSLTLPRKVGAFYLLMQRTFLMRLIESECCGRFVIYGRLEVILFLTDIVAIPHSS